MYIEKIKKLIRRIILGYDISNYFFSYSGEDAILQNIFWKKIAGKEKGFFVDIGAYHPYKGSNTYLFYIGGWTGINIDARPGCMEAFKKIRPKDINLEIGISQEEGILTYYVIDDTSPMNSFSKKYLEHIGMDKQIKKEIPVQVFPLKDILDKYSNHFKSIDIMNIDVEGYDLEVIKSNDWIKYRPKVIVIELECGNIQSVMTNKTALYLIELGYEIIAKNVVMKNVSSVFFVDKTFDY